ncbi:MAG: excinuclease ABC subunit UvrC [Pseudomonadota bacterium]
MAFDSKEFLQNLTSRAGVYRMYDQQSVVMYVGKAKNLKSRVSSYFLSSGLTPKTQVMVKQIEYIEVTITHTESEALLLENNLIKTLKPRYNILLRDDKSYPYIYLSSKDKFPRLSKHRGARTLPGKFYGPYPNAKAVKESLSFLQKIFSIRQCEDSFFKNRSRACLQYQIKRCTAPCVNLINQADYHIDVKHTQLFLEGKSARLIDILVEKMELASSQQEYESASIFRDQIISLRRIQEKQYINTEKGDIDVIAIAYASGIACIQVFFIRDGINLGNKSFFPKNIKNEQTEDILNAFLGQYYLNSINTHRPIPATILINLPIADQEVLQNIFKQHCKHKVSIHANTRGNRRRWIDLAVTNAKNTLQNRWSQKTRFIEQFEQLQTILQLNKIPQRIECFDISHSSGEATVASCVVFNHEGPLKSDYRRFNITNITPGDDYAAMQQALIRRYKKLQKDNLSIKTSNIPEQDKIFPDILLIDGGKGQVKQAVEVLEQLQIGAILIIGITKGEGRKANLDTLFVAQPIVSKQENKITKKCGNISAQLLSPLSGKVILPANSPALHLTQQLRDEAHRFAITSHRQRRDKKRHQSELENITGLGVKRRQLLLKQFGGIAEIKRSGIEDLSRIKGISKALATNIYNYFRAN